MACDRLVTFFLIYHPYSRASTAAFRFVSTFCRDWKAWKALYFCAFPPPESGAGSPPKLRTYTPALCTRTCGTSL